MSEHETPNAAENANLPALGRMFLWTSNPTAVTRFVYGLYVVCALLFAADFLYHKHPYLAIENITGFYALYGFLMCAGLVICARIMGYFLNRDETYYAPYSVDSETYPKDQLDKAQHDG